jgi:hypothetical protein
VPCWMALDAYIPRRRCRKSTGDSGARFEIEKGLEGGRWTRATLFQLMRERRRIRAKKNKIIARFEAMKHLRTIQPDFFARREGGNHEEIQVGAHLGEPPTRKA